MQASSAPVAEAAGGKIKVQHRMTGRKKMTLFYFSITLAIFSTALYHFSQRQIPADVNPAVSVIVTYVVSLGLCFILLYFLPPKDGIVSALQHLNWASYVLAFSLVGLEVGFLLAYRAGWSIGLAAVVVNVVASLILIPVALILFKDKLSWVNIVGILACLAGLVMMNWQH
jgi:drug/metabolite transporter (DMT)-like permease